ncbi:MAG: hypothetical protein AAB250_13525, partial [Bdellovibrionota bacterium]
ANRPTIQVPEMSKFWQTHYAREKLNHPILLATRYLRLVSNLQFAHEGPEVPFPLEKLDKPSLDFVTASITDASDRKRFNEFLAQPKFREWLTKNLFSLFGKKASPNATESLMKATGLNTLIRKRQLLPVNHLEFVAKSGLAGDAKLRGIGIEPSAFFENVREIVPELLLFHGTKQEAWYQLIVRDGFVPSESGFKGSGLYSVARPEIANALAYAGGHANLVVGFPLDADARIVDLRKPDVERAIMKYATTRGWLGSDNEKLAHAANELGIDAYVYELGRSGNGNPGGRAFLIKNGAVLGKPYGLNRKTMSFEALLGLATKVKSDTELISLATAIRDSGSTESQISEIADQVKGHEGLAMARTLVSQSVNRQNLKRLKNAYLSFTFHQQVYIAASAAGDPTESMVLKEANDSFSTIIRDLRETEYDAAIETFRVLSSDGFDVASFVERFKSEIRYTAQVDPWIPMLWFAAKRIARGTVTEPLAMAITFFFLVRPGLDIWNMYKASGVINARMLMEVPTTIIGPMLYFGFWAWGIIHELGPQVKERRQAQREKKDRVRQLKAKLEVLERLAAQPSKSVGAEITRTAKSAVRLTCPALFR